MNFKINVSILLVLANFVRLQHVTWFRSTKYDKNAPICTACAGIKLLIIF